MMLSLNIKSKQRGISLLEVMLSLAIIAIILVMAVRYYRTAQQSQQVSNAISMMNGIVAAQTQYAIANANQYALSMTDLIKGGYYPGNPASPVAPNNPWGQPISLAKGSAGFQVVFPGVPSTTCTALDNVIKNEAVTTSGCSGSGSINYTADFQ